MASSDILIFFAWVNQGDNTFNSAYARHDEEVFNLEIIHEEGQIPTAEVEIRNPRIGLMNPSRLHWAWISYTVNGYGPNPLFFGRLVGIPTNILYNTVKLQLISRDVNYIEQKQRVAETLKVYPNYDPIFFQVEKRDDPDAILEGWSRLYHVDRASGLVSSSDICVGEDGTVVFAEQDVFYDSVTMKLLQSPLKAVNVKAEVAWEQQSRGYLSLGSWAYPTLGSEPFVQDWPKSGSNLGGGYTAGICWAGERDPLGPGGEAAASTLSGGGGFSFSWTSGEKEHSIGDVISVSYNEQLSGMGGVTVREVNQMGLLDPFATDGEGNLCPVNIPAHYEKDTVDFRTFALDFLQRQAVATMGIVYNADRKRSERLEMTVKADVQPILIDPLVTEDTEQITLKSGDLSLPLINYLNWHSVGGGVYVPLGQFIFPDNPIVPGQTSSQICVQAGNTGATIPTFSNVAGATTIDGSVVWSSLGVTAPTESAQDWVRLGRIALGTLLLPKPISGAPDINSLLTPGALNWPPTGVAIPTYSVLTEGFGGPGALMHECTGAGWIGGFHTAALSGPPPASFHDFYNPTGQDLYICVQAGITGEFHTTFSQGVGSQTTDGSVIWQNIGKVSLPIGGWAGETPARSYFPSTRGQISVQHMICRARAKLRRRARAVQITFDTRFEVAAMLSCRMNGRISDSRLPAGSVLGKVIAYKLTASGDTGELKGNVTLGCTIGNGVLS